MFHFSFLTSPVGTINQRPVAILNVDKTNPNINETVTFDASHSTDDGRIDYYFFDFGDGTNSSWTPLSVVKHKYASEGTYNATLIVMDDFGVTSLDSNLVYIKITVVPEFPAYFILPFLMILIFIAIVVGKKKSTLRKE
ncbi:PKD domain-containing protein [Candidatus Bathyarchaeota archaeon]|nr:PKD domain-containing protein [Candidatus Bathyarchaeota archaeon]